MPIDSNVSNGSANGGDIEFSLNSNQQELFDCSSLKLEIQIKILKPDGSNEDENAKLAVNDDLGRRI